MAQNRFKRIRPVGVRPRPTNTNVDQPPQNFNTGYNNNNSNTSYQSNTGNTFDNTYTSSYNETNTFDNDGFYNGCIDDTSNLNSLNDNNNVNNNNNNNVYNATNDDFNSYDFNNNFDASHQQQHNQQEPQTMYDNNASMQQTQSSQPHAFSRVRPKKRAIPPSRPNTNNFVPNNNNNNNNNDNFMNSFTNVQGSSQQIASGAIGSDCNSSNNNSNSNLGNNGDFLQSAMTSVTGNSMAGAMAAGMFKNAVTQNEEIIRIIRDTSFTSLHYYKYYFHVNNSYVLNKLKLLLLPFLKSNGKDWRRKAASSVSFNRGNTNNNNNNNNNNNGNNMNGNNIHTPSVQPIFNSPYATAVDDVNAPEGYIPLMAVITYIVIMGFLTGTTQGQLFTPQILISTASSAFGGLLFEVILMKLGFYLIGTIANPPILLDLICYSGYKLVFVTLNLLIFIMIDSLIVYYIVSIGTGIIASIFMIQTFRPYFVKMAESNTSLMSNLSQMSMGSMSNVLQGNEPQKLKQVFLAFVGLWQIIFIQFMGRKMA